MLEATLKAQNGVVFVRPALVYRATYCGRDILAPNRSKNSPGADERGYVPVEWWLASITVAENPLPSSKNSICPEGVSGVVLSNKIVPMNQLADQLGLSGNKLGGLLWPLIKILDIGGSEVDFEHKKETPPIPAHIHAGYPQADGSLKGPGKYEAYYFPPLDVPPWNNALSSPKGIVTRLGLRPDVSKEEVLRALREFGTADRLYGMLNTYPIEPNQGWTIVPGVVHSPGPWLTLEMQTPQDDYNLLAWQMGDRLKGTELAARRDDALLKGLPNEQAIVDKVIDWKLVLPSNQFEQQYRHLAEPLETTKEFTRHRIFFGIFSAEVVVVKRGGSYTRPKNKTAFAGLVWSGVGSVNGTAVSQPCLPVGQRSAEGESEFIVTAGVPLHVVNSGNIDLRLYLFFPIDAARARARL